MRFGSAREGGITGDAVMDVIANGERKYEELDVWGSWEERGGGGDLGLEIGGGERIVEDGGVGDGQAKSGVEELEIKELGEWT